MKRFIFIQAFFLFILINIEAQSNRPMATEIPRAEPSALPAPPPERRITVHALTWDAPREMKFKDRLIITLRANSRISRLPPSSFFMPKVPQNVILASASITPQEASSGIVLKLTLIPLSAGLFVLPSYTLNQDDSTRFLVPELRLLVRE